MSSLRIGRIEAVPIVHGRLAFAVHVRRRILENPPQVVAVELPEFLGAPMAEALELLPEPSVITYRHHVVSVGENSVMAVPVQPADGIVEALRIAITDRIPVAFVDAELDADPAPGVIVPDPHGIHGLTLEHWFEAIQPLVERLPHRDSDQARERHMAHRLCAIEAELQARVLAGEAPEDARILFVVGLAHWERIRRWIKLGDGELTESIEVEPQQIAIAKLDPGSMPLAMGELPFIAARYEIHRAGFEIDDFDPARSVKSLLLHARRRIEARDSGSLENPDLGRIRTTLDYLRKLCVTDGLLIPDSYRLAVAAKGCVGNEFALEVLACATSYPLRRPTDPLESPWIDEQGLDAIIDEAVDRLGGRSKSDRDGEGGRDRGRGASQDPGNEFDRDDPLGDDFDGAGSGESPGMGGPFFMDEDGRPTRLQWRNPGTPFTLGRLELERRPDRYTRSKFREAWDDSVQCSWPPEDIVIEDFRAHVAQRALSLAKIGRRKTEPFTTSFLDGLDLRATLRDVIDRKLHVFEEPRTPGAVGALVLIFEEDDYGERYPWRTTWHAEHDGESTLAFYATDFSKNLIGPGIARAQYGGCMLIYPPIGIPDVWHDFRFERARTPSERLLLAATYWSKDRYVVHVSKKPPRTEVRNEAAKRNKHLLHLPLSTFSPSTLERLRRVHVLNGKQVRSYANRFIR